MTNDILPISSKFKFKFKSNLCLCMARRMQSNGKSKSNHNKNTKNTKNTKSKKESKKKSNSSNSNKLSIPNTSTSSSSSAGAGTKRSSPPWQVMSKKDQAKNAKELKHQREQINHLKRMGQTVTTAAIPSSSYKADLSSQNTLLSDNLRSILSWKRFKPITSTSSKSTSSSSSSSSSLDLQFIGSYLNHRTPPSLGVPEIAFLGRSNVGKSSLLNKLVSTDIARVGKTPGATASVNVYAMVQNKNNNNHMNQPKKPILGLVDLPGFGYAKLSKEIKESVEIAAERYLNSRMELALGILLVDSRREPTGDDKSILAALYDMGLPLVVVATKVDKLKSNERERCINNIRDALGLPDNQPLEISSVTGEGVKDLWRIIMDGCEQKVKELKGEQLEDDGDYDDDDDDDDWWDSEDNKEDVFVDDEDLVYDQGYDWLQQTNEINNDEYDPNSFYDQDFEHDQPYYDDDYDSPNQKMIENQERQAMENEAMKLKNLKKIARRLDRRGEI